MTLTSRMTAMIPAGALVIVGCAPDEDADPVDRPDETLDLDEGQEPGRRQETAGRRAVQTVACGRNPSRR